MTENENINELFPRNIGFWLGKFKCKVLTFSIPGQALIELIENAYREMKYNTPFHKKGDKLWREHRYYKKGERILTLRRLLSPYQIHNKSGNVKYQTKLITYFKGSDKNTKRTSSISG